MADANHITIPNRRKFLLAAGQVMAVSALGISVVQAAPALTGAELVEHHIAGLRAALVALYPDIAVTVGGCVGTACDDKLKLMITAFTPYTLGA